ncbi:MAG TPA: hypothetical protein VMK12_32730 [Anaeromyxobacteraceae bacterium]|nr:hypothetical protein [Anaeromyxobacteraceae bacterium]
MRHALRASLLTAVSLAFAGNAYAKTLEARYLFGLADVNGTIRSSWVTLAYDREHHELLVADSSEGAVRVYKDNGMELQRIGGDEETGYIMGVAVREDGDLLLLARKKDRTLILHTDFRGELLDAVEPHDVPDGFTADFSPTGLRYADGKVFIVDHATMKVLVTDTSGKCVTSYDFHKLIKFEEKLERAVVMRSFNVDASGNLLFTIPSIFKAYVVSPSGNVQPFGTKGSTPGKFNIAGGIARDEQGNVYVTDLLRAVVMVFDSRFEFIGEFGYRGWGEGRLISPLELVVADGKVFVAQAGRRGVSIFRVAIHDSATERAGR